MCVFRIPGANCFWTASDIFGLAELGIGLIGLESPATEQQKVAVVVVFVDRAPWAYRI